MRYRLLVTCLGRAPGSDAVAAGALLAHGPLGVVVEVGRERPRPATVVAHGDAKELEEELDGLAGCVAKARGGLVFVSVREDGAAEAVSRLDGAVEVPLAVVASPGRYREILELGVWDRVLIRAGEDRDSALAELVMAEAKEACPQAEFAERPGPLEGRRALAGRRSARPGREKVRRGAWGRLASRGGQATPLVLGGVFALVLGATALVAVSGAITGKARAQRTADLSAMSAARSMKDDLPRLLAPPRLPNGLPNPAHMPKPVYLGRARLAAVEAAVSNGASPLAVSVRFPDSSSYAPLRARVSIATSVEAGPASRRHRAPPSWAEARVGAGLSMGAVPAMASGGGYSGPLAERQGHGLRPDVARAFDLMSAAAGAAGVSLTINSAFRSDAEQAALFAANPDPTWVAPPGRSLHRCATELDLGPPSAYGWLAANAGRFGFVQRYSWEAWHFGYSRGPAPCSDAGNSVGAGGGDRSLTFARAFPPVTPDWVKPLVVRAAARWNVSPALLAAQLFAESSFDPNAGNGIAFGIAAFTPAAAAEYGLEDPFDPAAAILAQAHLMSDLLGRFGSPALALAAYNAGPGAVGSCNCIPAYPETQAYVAKILGMLGGMGAIAPMPMEIELVK